MTDAPQPRQLTPKQQAQVELMAEVKFQVRMLLQKYASQAYEVSNGETGTELPVISFVQMALAQAATEFLVTAGMEPPNAVQAMTHATESAMRAWLGSLFKQHSKSAPEAGQVNGKKKRNGKPLRNARH